MSPASTGIKSVWIAAAVWSLLCSSAWSKVCVVEDFGAVGNGIVPDTVALQTAINECAFQHDVVQLAHNTTYLTGSLTIRGATKLKLERGTRLLASIQREDYGPTSDSWYLLRLDGCQGCSIVGEGTIDGQAQAYVYGQVPGDRKLVKNFVDPSCSNPKQCRPRLVGVVNSTQVSIHGVQLLDCIYWCLHIFNSTAVQVHHVNITADFDIANNDGIDIDGSSHVVVHNCNIHTADDGICIKTTQSGLVTSNVNVWNCKITSKSSAVKIGSESHGNMSRLRFWALQISKSHRGLGIQIRDQGNLTDVVFTNITVQTQLYNRTWWGGGEPIYVTAGPRNWAQTGVGGVTDVKFRNIKAVAEAGIVVVGYPSIPVEVEMNSVTLSLTRSSDWPGGYRDLRPGFMEVQNGVSIPAVFAANVSRLSLSTFHVKVDTSARPEWGELLEAESASVRELNLGQMKFEDGRAADPFAPDPVSGQQGGLLPHARLPQFAPLAKH